MRASGIDTDTTDLDPLSEAFAEDPWAAYRQLRAARRPLFCAAADAWLLARWSDVDGAARDSRLVRGTGLFMGPEERAAVRRRANFHDMPNHERFVQFSLLEIDGEQHRRLRLLLLGELTRQRFGDYQPAIAGGVIGLVDAALERGTIDFVEDVAAQVPGLVIGELLGIPVADRPQLRHWSDEIVQFFDVARRADHKIRAEAATTAFADYLGGLLADRRAGSGTDLLSYLGRAHDAGKLNHTELISTAMLVLMAGHGSTIDGLGNAVHALAQFPEQQQRLRDCPELWATAVDEFFRFDAPLPYFHRFASVPVSIGGQQFPVGTRFGLLYGAANRDPEVFPEPDTLDPGRRPNRHLSFGRGAHLCLGNHFARLSITLVLRELLERTRMIEPRSTEVTFRPGLAARGPLQLPVCLHPA